ncbi:IS30-like element ISCfr4 family transposase [Actinocorallia aurea]
MRDYGLSAVQQEELWCRWREGASLRLIAREFGVGFQHVQRFLRQTGGIKVAAPRRSPRHLASAEREEISRGLAAGLSARAIAGLLGRNASTVSREIRRNGGREAYRACEADAAAVRRSRRPKPAKLAADPELRALVEELLDRRWSPEQVSGRLRLMFPGESARQVSYETIYLSLFDPRRRALNRALTARLRTYRAMRHPRAPRKLNGQGQSRHMLPIGARPAEADDRATAGHWEGDLVLGTRPSAIATLVERTSRYVELVALPDGHKAHQVRDRLTQAALAIPEPLRRSMTWDRGAEMAEHQAFTAATSMPVYFCTPRSPWQRGTNENTNGLLRQYLPKRLDLKTIPQEDLDAIAAELNNRPRKTHGYRTANEVYADICQQAGALTV